MALNVITKKEVAVKFEAVSNKHPQLENEELVYRQLAGGVGIPAIDYFGVESGFNYLVLERLGPSLKDTLICSGGQLSLHSVLDIAEQLVS